LIEVSVTTAAFFGTILSTNDLNRSRILWIYTIY